MLGTSDISFLGTLVRPEAKLLGKDFVSFLKHKIQLNEPLLFNELEKCYHAHSDNAAMKSLHEKALQGNLESVYELADYYQQGKEVPDDLYLSFRLIRYAAWQGHEPAFALLGKYYA